MPKVIKSLLILVGLCLYACKADVTIPTSYPLPTNAPTPTRDATLGVVIGTLKLQGVLGASPVPNQPLILGTLLKDNTGVERVATYDPSNALQAMTDEVGYFEFRNIPEGRYTLFFNLVAASYLLFKPGTQDVMIIEVKAGHTADFGELIYDALPDNDPSVTPDPTMTPKSSYP
jgi:hypothetical protein